MVKIKLVFRNGHVGRISLDDEDGVIGSLVSAISAPATNSNVIFNLRCSETNRSLVFKSASLDAVYVNPALDIVVQNETVPNDTRVVSDSASKRGKASYCVIDDFFPASDNRLLYSAALESLRSCSPARTSGNLAGVRRGYTAEPSTATWERMAYSIIPLNATVCGNFGLAFNRIEKLECEIAAYLSEGKYGPHCDLIDSAADGDSRVQRVLSFSYYMHSHPKRFTGGELRLHLSDPSEVVSIEHVNNRIVLFPSAVLHEICEVTLDSTEFAHSRLALNGWVQCSF
jgi:SM-20-related protein